MRGQEHRLPTIDEIIEQAKRGIIDDSLATALLAELEQAETRGPAEPDEPADERRQVSA